MHDDRVWTEELLESPHEAADKAGRVRRMFNAIAPRYALINTVFSAGRDAYWRRKAVGLARVTPADDVLDVACGTGDFARAFAAARPRSVTGSDFAHQMLLRAAEGRAARQTAMPREPSWVEADALRLPFRDGSFSISSCAFGVRNFEDLSAGLAEMHRVLRPGGRAVILEFSRPRNRLVRAVYEVYANRVMPVAAAWLSGDRSGAYRYLPRSVVSFIDNEELCARLHRAGFAHTAVTPLTLGIVTAYVAARI